MLPDDLQPQPLAPAQPVPLPASWSGRVLAVLLVGIAALAGSAAAHSPAGLELAGTLIVTAVPLSVVLATFGPDRSMMAIGLALGRGRPSSRDIAQATGWWLLLGTTALAAGGLGAVAELAAGLPALAAPAEQAPMPLSYAVYALVLSLVSFTGAASVTLRPL
jgi:hypothetical protein